MVSTGAAATTVSVALPLVALPAMLLTTARKVAPLSRGTDSGVEQAGAFAPAMSTLLSCH